MKNNELVSFWLCLFDWSLFCLHIKSYFFILSAQWTQILIHKPSSGFFCNGSKVLSHSCRSIYYDLWRSNWSKSFALLDTIQRCGSRQSWAETGASRSGTCRRWTCRSIHPRRHRRRGCVAELSKQFRSVTSDSGSTIRLRRRPGTWARRWWRRPRVEPRNVSANFWTKFVISSLSWDNRPRGKCTSFRAQLYPHASIFPRNLADNTCKESRPFPRDSRQEGSGGCRPKDSGMLGSFLPCRSRRCRHCGRSRIDRSEWCAE